MSGYAGADDESLHAIILSENGVHASRQMLKGHILTHCSECGDPIPEARRKAGLQFGVKIEYCISCQTYHDKARQPKMLTKML